ncbi:MAG: hypothetical protein WA945_06450 [Arcobacteraceae bacterium]
MSEENNKCKYKDIKDYKSAFECFKQRFLIEKKSIFDLSDIDTKCNEEESKNSRYYTNNSIKRYLTIT